MTHTTIINKRDGVGTHHKASNAYNMDSAIASLKDIATEIIVKVEEKETYLKSQLKELDKIKTEVRSSLRIKDYSLTKKNATRNILLHRIQYHRNILKKMQDRGIIKSTITKQARGMIPKQARGRKRTSKKSRQKTVSNDDDYLSQMLGPITI